MKRIITAVLFMIITITCTIAIPSKRVSASTMVTKDRVRRIDRNSAGELDCDVPGYVNMSEDYIISNLLIYLPVVEKGMAAQGSVALPDGDYVFVANNVRKSPNQKNYSTLALEISRQNADSAYNTYDTSVSEKGFAVAAKDYAEEGDSFVVIVDSHNREAARSNGKDGEVTAPAGMEIIPKAYTVSFIDNTLSNDGNEYVTSYFLISVQDIKKFLTEYYPDWLYELEHATESTYVKVNKIMVMHNEVQNPYDNRIKGTYYGYIEKLQKDYSNPNVITTVDKRIPFNGKTYMFSRRKVEESSPGYFAKYATGIWGEEPSSATKNGITNSWHQSVQISEATYSSNNIILYDVDSHQNIRALYTTGQQEEYGFTIKGNGIEVSNFNFVEGSTKYQIITENYGSYPPTVWAGHITNSELHELAKLDYANVGKFIPARGIWAEEPLKYEAAKKTFTYDREALLQKAKITNHSVYYIPCRKATAQLSSMFYDVDTEKFYPYEVDVKITDGTATYVRDPIFTTKDNVEYTILTDAKDYGENVPVFLSKSGRKKGDFNYTYASIKAKSTSDNVYKADITTPSGKVSFATPTGAKLEENCYLIIPMRMESGKSLVYRYIDSETGASIGDTVRVPYQVVDNKVEVTVGRSISIDGVGYLVVTSGAKNPELFFASDKAKVQDASYSKAKSSYADGMTEPNILTTSSKVTYSVDEDKTLDYNILYIPVTAAPKITVNYYTVDYETETPTKMTTEEFAYDAEKKTILTFPVFQFEGTLLSKTTAETVPTGWVGKEDEWRTFCSRYKPVIKNGDGSNVSYTESDSVKVTIKKNKLSGEVSIDVYYALDPESEPIITPPEPIDILEGEIVIIKNPDTDDPNTRQAGLTTVDSQDSYAMPDAYTHNDNDLFNIGSAIPTTEQIDNGIDVDVWYGHVGITCNKVSPMANLRISAFSEYMTYTPESHTYSIWTGEYYTTEEWSENAYYRGTYADSYDEDGKPIGPVYAHWDSGWVPVIHYDRPIYKPKELNTGYTAGGYTSVAGVPLQKPFDLHDAEYNYHYYNVSAVNMLKFTDAIVENDCFESDLKYYADLSVPYKFILNPFKGNGINARQEASSGETLSSLSNIGLITHVERQSDLTWAEIFEGKIANRTVPLTYNGITRQTDICYLKTAVEKYPRPDGGYDTFIVYEVDETAKNAIIAQCKESATAIEAEYFAKEYEENMGNRLVMHSDTVSLEGHSYCVDNSNNGGYLGSSAREIVPTSSNERYKSKQTTTIPEATFNGEYWTKFTAQYQNFCYGSRTARLVIDDSATHTKFAISPALTNNRLSGVYADPSKTYKANEPIMVHSPVIAPIIIANPDNGNTQTATEAPFSQLLLDKTYTVNFDWKYLYKDFYSSASSDYVDRLGYFEDMNEGLTAYTKGKMIRYPFPVIMDGQYYPLTTSEINGGHTVKYTDWIALDESKWVTFSFYVPTWVRCGLYYDDPTGNSYSGRNDVINAAIEVKVIANNEIDDGIHDIPHYEVGIDQENYIATYKLPVQVSGWTYGFTVVSSNDQSTYGGDDIPEDNLFHFTEQKKDFKVGTYNRIGTNSVRLIDGETVVADWPSTYSLPMTTLKSAYTAMGTVKQGTRIAFELKTILGGEINAENMKVEIVPTYRYYSADGTYYDPSSIELYYDSPDAKMVKIGSARDTSDTASLKGSLKDAEYAHTMCLFAQTDSACSYGHIADLNCGFHMNTLSETARLQSKALRTLLDTKTVYGSLSKLTLPSTTMLYSGDENELQVNELTDGSSATRYNAGLGTISLLAKDDFEKSMQTWYGKYRIPNQLYIRKVKETDGSEYYGTLEEWFDANGSYSDPKEVFESDGYLVLNFDIKVYVKRGGVWTLESQYQTGSTDMWARENGGNPDYFAYSGAYQNDPVDGLKPVGTPVMISGKSGDVAVIAVGKQLGAVDGDEGQAGMLWINE